MTLRLQLLALGALTLLLPWAGVQVVRQVEVSLRTGLERSLLDSARARIVATQLDRFYRRGAATSDSADAIYLHTLSRPPTIDGFSADWSFVRDPSAQGRAVRALDLEGGSRLWAGISAGFVYLFIDAVDEEVVNQGVPGEAPHGDRVALVFGGGPTARSALLLANSAPGTFRAQPTSGGPRFEPTGGYHDTAFGAWQDTETGYAIEARLPLRLVGAALGVGIIDSDDRGRSARLAAATWDESGEPVRVVHEQPELNRILAPSSGGGERVRILDGDGWVLADSGAVETVAVSDSGRVSVAERFFRYVLRRDDPEYASHESRPGRIGDPVLRRALDGETATAWYRRGAEASAIVAAAVPIDSEEPGTGAVVLEQASDPILTLANQAMMRLMTLTIIIIVVTAAGLLAYASFLSFRIGRLARAAESALGPGGEIITRVPGTKGRDELGDLSRAFADLLGRLRDYTEYLQSLKSKLSHELRTPLAIVATSLDNLEHELKTRPGRDYLDRLRHGTERLESILQAMTAATRVEQAIADTAHERFDLSAVIASCMKAYGDVYPGQSFRVRLPEEPVLIAGSAELIEQMLDKLIDNAVSFAEAGSEIVVRLRSEADQVRLEVVNRGPELPQAMRHQLFDSLVSVRKGKDEKPHLGLGLYIVMLVAEFHGGRVEAENLADGSGVSIGVVLPRSDARSA
ncbi:MAG TPA: ATP-binding protein [Gammaproteobacteria bacterium]